MQTQFFQRLGKPVLFIVLLWVPTLIATPILLWTVGMPALTTMVYLGVILQAIAVMAALFTEMGVKQSLLVLLPILPMAWLAEFLGTRTGFPFGEYTYTSALQPQLGGVPLLIPFAWLMMLPPAWAVADRVLNKNQVGPLTIRSRIVRAFLAALAFTVWDLFLDPQLVGWGFWHWTAPGAYFGIPLTNYLGWFLVSFLISCFFIPKSLPVVPLILIYAITWFLTFFGEIFFWGLPGPGVVGFLGMGSMLLLAITRGRK